MKEIKNYWNRIEKWFEKNKPEDLKKLGDGATEEEISELEKYIMSKLPEDFRESLKIHNGQKEVGIILNDGWDNFYLFPLEKIREEFDYRNKNWEEIIEAYIETGEKFSAKEIPIYDYATGDITCLNPNTGKLLMVSHEGFSSKFPSFSSILKMNADYLESGRFYLDKYGCIGALRLDDTWKKFDSIPEIAKKLNDKCSLFDPEINKFEDFFSKKFDVKIWRYDLNSHFIRTFIANHNGQKTKEHLFTDGEDEFEFLSLARIIEEYEEISYTYGKIVPFFKNNENGNAIYVDIFTKIYNTCKLFKYYKNKNEIKPIEQDLLDILLLSYNKYKS
ncbi:MAG: SMI1/KNR4 family protein [Candidatus Hodarchaeota archaeon]